jgi:CelD/BcsL family acetyltransferase involved in cellulose biosynthesis
MEFQIIQSVTELEALAETWNTLLHKSASHVPFLRHEYLMTWWQTLGGGEWETAELAVVIARRDGDLVGIAPLFFSNNREGDPALLLLGSIEISDYLDIIAREQDLSEFIDGLLEFITGDDLPPWQVLDFYNILDNSPTLAVLEQATQARGWSISIDRLQHSPYIPLPGDWEVYLAGIDKKQRHEIRRKMRRAENAEKPVRWYFVTEESELEAESEAFMTLMAQDPEKAAFLTEPMREHMLATIRCAFREDCLQLSFLEINGEKAAGYLNFDYRDRIWVYNSGLDGRFREYSPGWVLLGYLLQWANENNRHAFDFMRGDEDYKYRFGAVDRFVMRAVVRRM